MPQDHARIKYIKCLVAQNHSQQTNQLFILNPKILQKTVPPPILRWQSALAKDAYKIFLQVYYRKNLMV